MNKADVEDGRRPGVTKDEHEELVALRRELRVAKMEVEILKRAAAFFAGRTSSQNDLHLHRRPVFRPAGRGVLSRDEGVDLRLLSMESPAVSDRDWDDAVLTNTIVDIHRMSRRSYGSPRVHAELRLGLDTFCSRKRVERLMRQAGVQGIYRRRGHGCTRRDGSEPS